MHKHLSENLKGTLGRSRHKGEVHTKIDVNDKGCEMTWIKVTQAMVHWWSVVHMVTNVSFMKDRTFLNELSDYQRLKIDFGSCS
jgi:hypothetical protein